MYTLTVTQDVCLIFDYLQATIDNHSVNVTFVILENHCPITQSIQFPLS